MSTSASQPSENAETGLQPERRASAGVLNPRLMLLPALVAVCAAAAIMAAIDPAGSYPGRPQGPGLTLDEVFNVELGVYHVRAVTSYGIGLLTPESIHEVFGNPDYNPDHPPLGRVAIGIAHELVTRQFPPASPGPHLVTAAARTASAVLFALTVFLVGTVTGIWCGRAAGAMAAIGLVCMPRVFGHAHLASLETSIGLAYAGCVLLTAHFWNTERPPSSGVAAWTGVLFGLALLTKIQAILLPVPIAVWAISRWQWRAGRPLALWCLAGLAVFFVGWPWLWLDPLTHAVEYFSRATARVELFTWYFGERFADRDVPWHYPVVLFAVTVPLGLHVLGGWGAFVAVRRGGLRSREALVLASALFPLCVFAAPGVAVYDGARLFLVSFPLWAVFIGWGGRELLAVFQGRLGRRVGFSLLSLVLLAQASGLPALHPCYLSYYSALCGGLPGAERLGLEVNYWGDALTRSLLEKTAQYVPPGSEIEFMPLLHVFQLQDLLNQCPALRDREIRLRPYDDSDGVRGRYVLFFRRKADFPASLEHPPADVRRVFEVRRQGVVLAGLYEFPP